MCEARNTSMRTVPFSLIHDVYVFYLCLPSRADNCTVDSYTDKCIGIDIDIFVDMHSHKQHTNELAIIHVCTCTYSYMFILYTCIGVHMCAEGRAVMQACIQHNALCRHRLGCPLSKWRIYALVQTGPACRVPRLLFMDEQQDFCSTAREPVELLPSRQTCSMLEARQGGCHGTCCGSVDFLPSRRMCSSGLPGLLKLRVQCRTTARQQQSLPIRW